MNTISNTFRFENHICLIFFQFFSVGNPKKEWKEQKGSIACGKDVFEISVFWLF